MGGPQATREVKIRGSNTDSTVTSSTDGVYERLDVSAKLNQDMYIPIHDKRVIDETNPASITITYSLSGATVATKTIAIAGAVTTITLVLGP